MRQQVTRISALCVFFVISLSNAAGQTSADLDPYPIEGLSVERAIELCTPAAYAAAVEMGLSLNPAHAAKGWRTEARQIAIALVLAKHRGECPPQTRFVCRVGIGHPPQIVTYHHGIVDKSCS